MKRMSIMANENLNNIPTSHDPLIALEKPELVFGIVGPVGTDRELIIGILKRELGEYGYTTHRIHVSRILHQLEGLSGLENIENDEYQRIHAHMDAGTRLREVSNRGDALALLSVAKIREIREQENGEMDESSFQGATAADVALPGVAYILDSLKHPAEIDTLRAIYGRAFVVISVFTPRDVRIASLAERLAKSKLEPQNTSAYRASAEDLVQNDEKEPGTKLGQNVRSAFPLADFFVDSSDLTKTEKALERLLELEFNNPFRTPTPDEYGMFFAEASSWRSGDLARQVGAAITSESAELLAVGCNEVPKPFGGYYWDEESGDARDLVLGVDSGTEQKQLMVAEILKRVRDSDFLDPSKSSEIDSIIKGTVQGDIDPFLTDVRALSVIEYGRSVHAEMAALCDAAKRGASVDRSIMYVNTFPCHICARHILASGIRRLVYIEPYPKSLTEDLYRKQVDTSANKGSSTKVAFEPFCGVAPRLYQFLFQLTSDRKKPSGKKMSWTKAKARPKLKRYVMSYIAIEQQVVANLIPRIRDAASGLQLNKLESGTYEVQKPTGGCCNGESSKEDGSSASN